MALEPPIKRLSELQDVSLSGVVAGQALVYTGSSWGSLEPNINYVQQIVLNGSDIVNKNILLTQMPKDSNSLRIFVESNGGLLSEQDVDYTITGSEINWASKVWDGILEEGDKLKIFYW